MTICDNCKDYFKPTFWSSWKEMLEILFGAACGFIISQTFF